MLIEYLRPIALRITTYISYNSLDATLKTFLGVCTHFEVF